MGTLAAAIRILLRTLAAAIHILLRTLAAAIHILLRTFAAAIHILLHTLFGGGDLFVIAAGNRKGAGEKLHCHRRGEWQCSFV